MAPRPTTGWLHEVFASIQGEGICCGQRHTFVRFAGCNLACDYCDTAYAREPKPAICRVELVPGSGEFTKIHNPVSVQAALDICLELGAPTVSLTGGEPLAQVDFARDLMSNLRSSGFLVYLETNGLEHAALRKVIRLVHIVAMDFKLESATGCETPWEAHEKFLRVAAETEVFAKAVVSHKTTAEEIGRCASIIAKVDPSLVLVIQPATGSEAPPSSLLMTLQDAALESLEDVRVIPQCHKLLGLP